MKPYTYDPQSQAILLILVILGILLTIVGWLRIGVLASPWSNCSRVTSNGTEAGSRTYP